MIVLKYIGAGFVIILLVLISLFLFLFRDGFARIDRAAYPVEESSFSDWDMVFKNPSEIEVIPVNTGTYYLEGDAKKNAVFLLLSLFGLKLTFEQEQGEDIINQLKMLNVDLKYLFLTHLHVDHTAGMPGLPADAAYVMHNDEITFFNKALSFAGHFKGKKALTFDETGAREMPILGKCIDLFGDGSLWAVATYGHSPGQNHIWLIQPPVHIL